MLHTWDRIRSKFPSFSLQNTKSPLPLLGTVTHRMEALWQIGQNTRLAIRRVLGLRPTLTTGWTDLFLKSNDFSSSATLIKSRLVCLLLFGIRNNDVMLNLNYLFHSLICSGIYLSSNSAVVFFTSHKNQISESVVRRNLRFFVVIEQN